MARSSPLTSLPGMPRELLAVPMEPKYLCLQCRGVLRKPFQAQCGHRFCVHCLTQLTSAQSPSMDSTIPPPPRWPRRE